MKKVIKEDESKAEKQEKSMKQDDTKAEKIVNPLTQLPSRKKQRYAYIPLQILSDPTGTDGAWRGWSCIWLAHLMREAFKSSVSISNMLQQKSKGTKTESLGKLKKRGKYDTRREGKHWWKTSKDDAWNWLRSETEKPLQINL